MKELIINELKKIEAENNVRILHAVESGSRAWGFASPDSDYGVRFIYVRPKEDYLRLEEVRDVIELPIDDELDINGWDLQKALRLLYRSNPTLFEWFSSPIVYMETDFANQFRSIMLEYFCIQKSLYYYVSMAERNYRVYLDGNMVKAKKYFYVLRPVLACEWILHRQTPPPMLFSELVDAELSASLRPDIDRLLDLKMNSPEIKEIPKIDTVNEYLDQEITAIKGKIEEMPKEENHSWKALNDFFLQTINAF